MKWMHARPRSGPSDNLFKFNRMKNRVGTDNFLKSRLTPFILNNILASMTRDMGIRSQEPGITRRQCFLNTPHLPPTTYHLRSLELV